MFPRILSNTATLIALLMSALPLRAQNDSIIVFHGVGVVDSVTKEQLYANARQWFNKTVNNVKSVFKIEDKEAGQLSGSFYITSYYSNRGVVAPSPKNVIPVRLHVDFDMLFKDGRYRYEFTNFYEEDTPGSLKPNAMGVLRNRSTSPIKFTFMSQKRSDEIYQSTLHYLSLYMTELVASLKKDVETAQKKFDF